MRNNDRVICVKTSKSGKAQEGKIYTVAKIRPKTGGLLLKEVKPEEPFKAFKRKNFRKIDETFATGVLINVLENVEEEELVEMED